MCAGRGSNYGPLGPKSDALTTAPLRHPPSPSFGLSSEFLCILLRVFFVILEKLHNLINLTFCVIDIFWIMFRVFMHIIASLFVILEKFHNLINLTFCLIDIFWIMFRVFMHIIASLFCDT